MAKYPSELKAIAVFLAACGPASVRPPPAPPPIQVAPAPPPSEPSEPIVNANRIDFVLRAPIEQQRGELVGAIDGAIYLEPEDLTKAYGRFAIDLARLDLRRRRVGEDGSLEPEQRNETQNEHARQWLEIADGTPPELREKNRRAELVFHAASLPEGPPPAEGNPRRVPVAIDAELLLHGHKSALRLDLALELFFVDGHLHGIHARSRSPAAVSLAEHGIAPRDAAGKLIDKALEALAPKVAAAAEVSIDLTFVVAEGFRGRAQRFITSWWPSSPPR